MNGEAFETIYYELMQTALAVPQGAKEKLLQDYKRMVPTAEEIKAAIDWDSLTNHDVQEMLQQAGVVMADGGTKQIEMPLNKWAEMFGTDYEQMIDNYAQHIYDALDSSPSNDTLNSFIAQYMSEAGGRFDFGNVMAQYGPISDENYEQIVMEWQEAGTAYGNALNSGVSESILSGSQLLRMDIQTVLDDATANPFTVSPAVNVIPNYNIGATAWNVSGHASGGYVSGGPQLSWLAEEGYGEFVIPTNPSRRSRALDLYEQAGIALGVSAHASGGCVGEPVLSISDSYGGETIQTYELVPAERTGNADAAPIQVSVNVSPEFIINGTDSQNEESIMQIIRRHMKEIADELGGEIAGKLDEVFSNMPIKGV